MRRLFVATLGAFVMCTMTMLVTAPSASAAYGNTAKYQIGFSENCNNPTYCIGGDSGGLGGAWGWAVFNNDGTGDLQITFCGHDPGGGGGAGHEDVDIYAWHIEGGVFVIDSSSDPANFNGPTPVPATPGHYNMHPAPGVAMEITVALIPHR